MPEKLLTGIVVAGLLGIGPRTLDSWRSLPPEDPRRKLLPFVRVGSRVRYKEADVTNFIRVNTVAAPSRRRTARRGRK